MTPLVDDDGPITVPPGPIDKSLRDRIERAISQQVPEGKRFAVAAIYDFEGKELDAQLAVRLGKKDGQGADFKLVLDTAWDGHLSGFIGLAWSF